MAIARVLPRLLHWSQRGSNRSLMSGQIFFRHARRGFEGLSMSERSQPGRVGLLNVCIFLERNGDCGVYPCFDSANSLARVRLLRPVNCRAHSVTAGMADLLLERSPGERRKLHNIRFRLSAQKTKDPANAVHRPPRESVGCGRLCLRHSDAFRRSNHTLPPIGDSSSGDN